MSLLKSWLIPGVVAVAAVAAISLYSETEKMEADLEARAKAALDEKGMDWATISFEGRDGTLSGTAPEEGVSAWAVELLDATWGVRVVDDETDLLSEQSPYTWGLERAGKKLSMIGYLPYDLSDSVPDQMKALYDGVDFSSSIEAARGAPQDIGNVVAFASDLIKDLDNAKVMLIDNTLSISGELEDGNADHVAIFATIKDKIAGADLGAIELKLEIPEPQAPEDKNDTATVGPEGGLPVDLDNGFAIRRSGQSIELAGVVPSENVKESLLSLASRKFGASAVSDALTVREGAEIAGLSAEDYVKITQGALQAVSRLGDGEASLSAQGLALKGGAFYEAALSQLQERLTGFLPQGFTLNADLSVAEPGAAVDANECQALLKGALSNNTILFESGDATISSDSFGLLDGLAYTAHRCPDSKIEIAGHTDSDGDGAFNKALSEKRAGSVLAYLVATGLSEDRLQATGYGESQPVASNDTAEGKASNRRIEFVIMAQE